MNNRYEEAKQIYAKYGVDTDAAMAELQTIPVSLHCWQGDDVTGFDHDGPLTGGKPREQGTLRLHAVREPRQQARPGFLLRIFHSRQCGAPMDVRLGQAGGSQRGQDAEFLDGPYAGAVLPRIGSVRTVAQGKVGSSFQQGKQVTLARITTAAIPGGHQS